jgi:deazaflavin-dependent oxidoreductase (nitroreductase family)
MATMPEVDPRTPHGFLERATVAFALSRVGRWFAINIATRVDPVLLRLTGGRVSTFPMVRIVLLTVRGAKSGVTRTCPLLYFTDAGDVICIASSFGREHNPAWYYNLKANPDAQLVCAGRHGRYVAREVEGEDRERLFGLAQHLYRGYGNYAERASHRRIPVMRLSPAED